MTESKRKAVVLASGGLDSTVTVAYALERGFNVHALSVRYGQRHRVELEYVQSLSRRFELEAHKFIDLDLRVIGGSALTEGIEVPKSGAPLEGGSIPITYVPARNTLFLSLAVAYAEAIDARDVFVGVSAVDYSGYPDCRPAFIEQFERVANLGTRAADGGRPFRVHAPLVRLSKAETIQLGSGLGVDFASTWSCYDPQDGRVPCRRCESCVLRAKGFADAGVVDPLVEEG